MQTRYKLQAVNGGVYADVQQDTKARPVNSHRLTIAKWQAVKLFRQAEAQCMQTFTAYVLEHYACKHKDIAFDSRGALKRIRAAQLRSLGKDCLGQTDGDVIEISRSIPMRYDEIVCTLLHEALHDWCLVKGRRMACHKEHRCMHILGDPNE